MVEKKINLLSIGIYQLKGLVSVFLYVIGQVVKEKLERIFCIGTLPYKEGFIEVFMYLMSNSLWWLFDLTLNVAVREGCTICD